MVKHLRKGILLMTFYTDIHHNVFLTAKAPFMMKGPLL